MPDVDFWSINEAVRQLSTEYLFVVLLYSLGKAGESVVFSLDLIIIALTIFVQKVVSKHLTVRPMAQLLGYSLYYSNRQLRHLERIYRRGLEADRAGRQAGPSPLR